jgi:hypothetical protein
MFLGQTVDKDSAKGKQLVCLVPGGGHFHCGIQVFVGGGIFMPCFGVNDLKQQIDRFRQWAE